MDCWLHALWSLENGIPNAITALRHEVSQIEKRSLSPCDVLDNGPFYLFRKDAPRILWSMEKECASRSMNYAYERAAVAYVTVQERKVLQKFLKASTRVAVCLT